VLEVIQGFSVLSATVFTSSETSLQAKGEPLARSKGDIQGDIEARLVVDNEE
jgi:hypothetical protein